MGADPTFNEGDIFNQDSIQAMIWNTIDNGGFNVKKHKRKQRKKHVELYGEEFGQDENFFFIAGFTEGGTSYGITWEEAYADGLVEEVEPSETEGISDESLPF